MPLRLVEVHVPERVAERAEQALEELAERPPWREACDDERVIVRAVLGSGRTGAALDRLHEAFEGLEQLRVLVLPLDAVLPRPLEEREEEPEHTAGVSREEIYEKVSEGADLSIDYVALVLLATIVAAIGLVKDSAAAVIGAMVVAPLLGPNMALALGLTLADRSLVGAALRTSLVGVALAFVASLALAQLLPIDPGTPELASRAHTHGLDILLALAAGCAGTLAYTSGAPTYLVGVMVAVALLPPTVASGLFLGAGHVREAIDAGLLVAANVAAVNLVAMLTFLAKGLRPRTWWKAERARASARWGIAIWLALVALLAGLLLLTGRN